MFQRLDSYTHFLRLFPIVWALFFTVALSTEVVANAEWSTDPLPVEPQETERLFVPAEYGQVVFQKNGRYPQQIFIIGQSHRSAITGLSGPDTVKVQAEIYRIGEWLIREKNVGLLLPEGFFQRSPNEGVSLTSEVRESVWLDSQTLEAELSDTRRFVNADMLLNASYPVRLGQVEDKTLYLQISHLLGQARQQSSLLILSELNHSQIERTATMLQNIPEVVEKSFREGRIVNRQAIFTIGLAHIGEIIDFLQRGSIRLPGGEAGLTEETSVKLLDQGYGVTVIIPRTLAEDKEILRLAKVETD